MKIVHSFKPLQIDPQVWSDSGRRATANESWPEIERILFYRCSFSKRVISALKRYYFSGALPNWKNARSEDIDRRELNLFFFLWFYPRQDFDELVELRYRYISMSGPLSADVHAGFNYLLTFGIGLPCGFGELLWDNSDPFCRADAEVAPKPVPEPGGRYHFIRLNLHHDLELIARVMYHDLADLIVPDGRKFAKRMEYPGAHEFMSAAANWLSRSRMNVTSEKCLMQHQFMLDYMYRVMLDQPPHANSLRAMLRTTTNEEVEKILYRIAKFETLRETDEYRLRFTRAMQTMLDERDWHPQLKQMWERVNSAGYVPNGEVWIDA